MSGSFSSGKNAHVYVCVDCARKESVTRHCGVHLLLYNRLRPIFDDVVCPLTSLPPLISRELDVSCNKLEAMPPEIGRCSRLRKLKANGNYLTAIPEEVGGCALLEVCSAVLRILMFTEIEANVSVLRRSPHVQGIHIYIYS